MAESNFAEPEAAPPPSGGAILPTGSILVADRYRVEFDKPLASLNTSGALAFRATDTTGVENAYALLGHPGIPDRAQLCEALIQGHAANLLNPLDRRITRISGTEDGKLTRRLITIVQAPLGGPVYQAGQRFAEADIRRRLVPALLQLLAEFKDRNFTHRMIQPKWLFYRNAACTEIVAGEPFSAPAGMDQSIAYEPIEQALAQPEGRGEATAAADMFALGVTLLTFFQGREPLDSRTVNELMAQRLVQGTFNTYTGGNDVPGSMGALIKGLMADEPAQRWTLADVRRWADGLVPRIPQNGHKNQLFRPIKFLGKAVNDRRQLAAMIAAAPLEGGRLIAQPSFATWLRNAIVDAPPAERLERMLGIGEGSAVRRRSALDLPTQIARTTGLLDPAGPIRYKHLAFMPDGLNTMLALAFARDDRETLNALNELMGTSLLAELRDIGNVDSSETPRQFSRHYSKAEAAMRNKYIGGGLERCLYEMNPTLPCQSSRIADLMAPDIATVLAALDRLTGGEDADHLIDRHIGAFLAAQSNSVEKALRTLALAEGRPLDRVLATLEFLAGLHQSAGHKSLRRLCGKLAQQIKPFAQAFKSKTLRERILARLEELAETGDIEALSLKLRFREAKAEDDARFREAAIEFSRLEQARRRLDQLRPASDPEAQRLGQRAAVFLSFVTLAVTSFHFFYPR